jgi:hypothetical protein
MYNDVNKEGKKILVCIVGKKVLHYDGRVVHDLYTMFKMQDKRMYPGGADEQKVQTKIL